jgi:predicted nuclease of predicted toxin-antitoxin system
MAFPKMVREEWRRYAHRYARKWFDSMSAQRKAPMREPTESAELRAAFRKSRLTKGLRETVAKDLHLLETALAADGIIVTKDRNLRRAMENDTRLAKIAARIRWFNPVTDDLDELKRL